MDSELFLKELELAFEGKLGINGYYEKKALKIVKEVCSGYLINKIHKTSQVGEDRSKDILATYLIGLRHQAMEKGNNEWLKETKERRYMKMNSTNNKEAKATSYAVLLGTVTSLRDKLYKAIELDKDVRYQQVRLLFSNGEVVILNA